MGWTAHYQFLRNTPLSPDEIAALAALNLESATSTWDGSPFGVRVAPSAREDGVLAEGVTKLPMGFSDDAELLDTMLMRVLEIAAGAELRIVDDFNAFGWDTDKRCISGGRSTPEPVDVARDELVDPKTISAPALPPVPGPAGRLVEASGAGQEVDATALDDDAVASLLGALPRIETDDPRRPAIIALLDRAAPDRVVSIGFRDYESLATNDGARSAIKHALEKVERPADFVEAFLEVWCNPGGVYYYGDLPMPDRFRDVLASAPEVVEQLVKDVSRAETAKHEDEMAFRRGEHAIRLLARGRTDRGLHALVAMIRRCRDREQGWQLELNVFDPAHEHLAIHGDTRVFATLLHFLGTMVKDHRGHRAALEALVRLDPERARPHIFAVADLGAMTPTVVAALAALGDDEARDRVRALAVHPDRSARWDARRALTECGIDPGPEPTPPPAEDLITHPSGSVRHAALRELHDRKDLSLMLSLCAAEGLDAILRARTNDGGLPFSWYNWDEILPPKVSGMRREARLLWALGDGAAIIGPQVRLAAIEPILASDAAAVAATIPSLLYRLTPEALTALRAEEEAMLAASGAPATAVVTSATEVVTPATAVATAPVRGAFETPPRVALAPTTDGYFGPALPKVEPVLTPGERVVGLVVAPVVASVELPADVDPRLAERLRKLAKHQDQRTERRSLETQDPLAVARAALAVLRELNRRDGREVRRALTTALEKIADRTPLRDAMIALWDEPAPNADWWRDLARTLEPAGADPALVAALAKIVLDDTGDADRRRSAIDLLARAKAAPADTVPLLVARLRRDRDRSPQDARWRDIAIEGLGRLGRAEAVSTLVLELAADTSVGWHPTLRALGLAAGADALPWLRRAFPCSGAAEYVIDTLEDIPAARDWLRELAASPEPRYRALVSRYLGRRGGDELSFVAAIWKTLDAVGYDPSSTFRKGALEALGVGRDEPAADWDVLVRQRGLEPIELPPLGDVLDGLVAVGDSRGRMIDRLGCDNPDPSLLLALVLALELDEALGRRGYGRAPSPKWDAWAALVPAWAPFATSYGYNDRMGEWVRAHRAELPPQRLNATLQQLLDDGADAVAATMPDPRFLLGPVEAISLDAAERVLLAGWEARRNGGAQGVGAPALGAADPGILPFDASELFGIGLEPAPARVVPEPRDEPTPMLDGGSSAEALVFVPGTTWLELDLDDPTLPWLTVEGALENRLARPIKLLAVDLAVRDADGHLTDVRRRVVRDQFWHHHDFSQRVGFCEGSFDRAHAVDLYVTHEAGFRARVLAADLLPYDGAPLEARTPWPYTLRPIEPGYPLFDARVAISRPRADYLRCEFVVELSQRTLLREASEVEVCVVLFNRGGSVVGKVTAKAVIESGGPTYVHSQLRLDLAQLRTARRIEVAVAGSTRRTERVASFALPVQRVAP